MLEPKIVPSTAASQRAAPRAKKYVASKHGVLSLFMPSSTSVILRLHSRHPFSLTGQVCARQFTEDLVAQRCSVILSREKNTLICTYEYAGIAQRNIPPMYYLFEVANKAKTGGGGVYNSIGRVGWW